MKFVPSGGCPDLDVGRLQDDTTAKQPTNQDRFVDHQSGMHVQPRGRKLVTVHRTLDYAQPQLNAVVHFLQAGGEQDPRCSCDISIVSCDAIHSGNIGEVGSNERLPPRLKQEGAALI